MLPILIIVLGSAVLVASAETYNVSVAGLLSGSSPTQSGRVFRNSIPSTCANKAYPGIYKAGTTYPYNAHGPYGPLAEATCVTVAFDPNTGATPCGVNAHASAYVTSYDPANQGMNFLGDSGRSNTISFSFTVPAGASYFVVVSATSGSPAAPGCTYSLNGIIDTVKVTEAPAVVLPGPGPDMVAMPAGSVVGTFVAETPLYYAPDPGAVTSIIMAVGKNLWVTGLSPDSAYYQVVLSGKFLWVPVNTLGPNYEAPWNGWPLPTMIIELPDNSIPASDS